MSARSLRVHPALLDDLRDAVAYYGEQDPTLPKRFIEAYADALTYIEEHPFAGREYLGGYRRVVATPFPYLVAYVVTDDVVYVAAMLHTRRDPATNENILRSRS